MIFKKQGPVQGNIMKVIDFGCACSFKPGCFYTEPVGSPGYVAPEVLMKSYNHECDLWSCGVLMYILLCGSMPFYSRNRKKMLAKVRRGRFSFEGQRWKNVSPDAKELICMLLEMNPGDRYTAKMSLKHKWLTNNLPTIACKSPANHSNDPCGSNLESKLRNAALHASRLNNEVIHGFHEVFGTFDANDMSFNAKSIKKQALYSSEDVERMEQNTVELARQATNYSVEESISEDLVEPSCNPFGIDLMQWPPNLFNLTRTFPTSLPSCWF